MTTHDNPPSTHPPADPQWLLAIFQYSQLRNHHYALGGGAGGGGHGAGDGGRLSPAQMRSSHLRERDRLREKDRQVISDIAAGHMAGLNTSFASFYGGQVSAQMRRTRRQRWKIMNPDKVVHR